MNTHVLPSRDLSMLHQLLAAATHEASAAMCRWTGGLISLSLDEVEEVPLEEVCGRFDCGDQLLNMVVLTLEGELGGAMLLMFDDVNARALAATLLGNIDGVGRVCGEIEKSALNETGNILACAYLNAMTRLVDHDLVPSPPLFLQDYGASALQQALLAQAADSDTVLVCRTTFHREGEELNWNVFFVPSLPLRSALLTNLESHTSLPVQKRG